MSKKIVLDRKEKILIEGEKHHKAELKKSGLVEREKKRHKQCLKNIDAKYADIDKARKELAKS